MVGGSLHRSLKKETQISYFQMLALKSTFFFLLIPDAFLILPGIGRGEFSIFLSLSLSLSLLLSSLFQVFNIFISKIRICYLCRSRRRATSAASLEFRRQ